VVDLAGIDQVVALAPAEIDAIEPVGLQAKPAIGSVSRWVQVFFLPNRCRGRIPRGQIVTMLGIERPLLHQPLAVWIAGAQGF